VPFSHHAQPRRHFLAICICQNERKERTIGKDKHKSALVATYDTFFPTIVACQSKGQVSDVQFMLERAGVVNEMVVGR
jgi:hypothetical protein